MSLDDDQLRLECGVFGVFGVEGGVVFGKGRVAAVAENALHEIQIAHQIARHEETDFHRFRQREAGHFGTNERAQQQ